VNPTTPTDPRLPDFLVIGAFKSGTTSLMSYLSQHPDITVPWLQEPNFFGSEDYSLTLEGAKAARRDADGAYGRRRTSTLAQYSNLFADAPAHSIVGESSPQYMTHPAACDRIRSLVPDCKLVAILRNPIDRAFSDYSMFVRDGIEKDPFAEVIHRPRSIKPMGHYVETGMYGHQLQPFFETFPADQVKVYLHDDLRADPMEVLRSLFVWLGADPAFKPNVSEMMNPSGVPRNSLVAAAYIARRRLQPYLKPIVPRSVQRRLDVRLERGLEKDVVDPKVRRELAEIFADDVALLSTLIDRDLSHWLRVPPGT
jgi:hypothetical protein